MIEEWTGKVVAELHVNGITQAELAEQMGVATPYVSALLNSKRKVAGTKERMMSAIEEIKSRRAGKTDGT